MDLVVFSHLRWNFVFQRPQHLVSRCARANRVFFWEEPVESQTSESFLEVTNPEPNLHVAVPHLPKGLSQAEAYALQEELLDELLAKHKVVDPVFWYYSPLAVNFTHGFVPELVVYDCMDELSAFKGAPPGLRQAEVELFRRAHLVFTGGASLYEAKRNNHPETHLFPSSIDRRHFLQARSLENEPADQAHIPGPKVGYCGVIDERMDLQLVSSVAELRSHWQVIMLGPVVKISESELPRRSNIHYLGAKKYQELPAYMSGWSVGLLPFALNESTRFISPTKTPEYLAAGLRVVSTPIADVVHPYGDMGLAAIAATPKEFVTEIEAGLEQSRDQSWLGKVDQFLARSSWDETWSAMERLIRERLARNGARTTTGATSPVSAPAVSSLVN